MFNTFFAHFSLDCCSPPFWETCYGHTPSTIGVSLSKPHISTMCIFCMYIVYMILCRVLVFYYKYFLLQTTESFLHPGWIKKVLSKIHGRSTSSTATTRTVTIECFHLSMSSVHQWLQQWETQKHQWGLGIANVCCYKSAFSSLCIQPSVLLVAVSFGQT